MSGCNCHRFYVFFVADFTEDGYADCVCMLKLSAGSLASFFQLFPDTYLLIRKDSGTYGDIYGCKWSCSFGFI